MDSEIINLRCFCRHNPVCVKWKLFLVCFVVLFNATQCSGANLQLKNELIDAKQHLTGIFGQSRDEVEMRVELSLQWSQSVEGLYPGIGVSEILWVNNNTLLTQGLELWTMLPQHMLKVAPLPQHSIYTLRFAKSFEFEGTRFLLICGENKCTLLKSYLGSQFLYCHSISDPQRIPVAAEFFTQTGHLFVVMLFQAKHSAVSRTMLYKWQETYMNRQLSVPAIMTTAFTIVVFPYEESIIFILGCAEDVRLKFPSQVWRREVNGDIRQVQYLPTWKLQSLTHLVEKGEHFLLAMEQNKANVYWWRGENFIQWIPVDEMLTYFSLSVSGNPVSPNILIFSYGNILKMYVMSSEKLMNIFETNFTSEMSIIRTSMYNEEDRVFVIVQYQYHDKMYINLYQLNYNVVSPILDEPGMRGELGGKTQRCLDSALEGLTPLQNQVSQLDSVLPTVLLTNKPFTLNPQSIVFSEEVMIDSGDIYNLTINQLEITRTIEALRSKITPLQKEIKTLFNTLETNKIHQKKHLVIMGNVFLSNASINNLLSDRVNNDEFDPSLFLKSTENSGQRLLNVSVRNLKANWLVLKKISNKPVQDLLLEYGKIMVPLHTSEMESNNMNINDDLSVNNVTVRDLLANKVTVLTREDSLHAILQVDHDQENEFGLQLQDFTVIENLNVDTINSIPVINLIGSLFLKNNLNNLNGSLHFTKGLRMNNLVTKRIYQPPNLTDSNPYSFYNTTGYYMKHWGPDLQNGSYYVHPDTYFNMHYNPVVRRIRRENQNLQSQTNRINVIKSKVKIIGNLKVRSLTLRNSSLLINKQSVSTRNLDTVFWTYNSTQEVLQPLIFSNGIFLKNVLPIQVINGINLSHCATWNSKLPHLVLQDVYVDGNVSIEENSLIGKKISKFQDLNTIEVKHLSTNAINGKNLDDLLKLDQRLLKGLKFIANTLNIKGSLEAEQINNIDVRKRFENAVIIDGDTHLHNITFHNLTAVHAQVESVNKLPASKLLGLYASQVNITSNLHLPCLLAVRYVNRKPIDLSLVVDRTKQNKIKGKKKFLGQIISLHEMVLRNMNGANTGTLFISFLRTSSIQSITGFYTIRNADFDSIFGVNEINGQNTTNLLFNNQPYINISGNVDFKSVRVNGNVVSSSLFENCKLPVVEDGMASLSGWKTSSVSVKGNCQWKPTSGSGLIQHLFESAVTVDGNQTITGKVQINNLFSKAVQVHSMNNRNITFIIKDAMYRNKKHQVVTGKKVFLGPVKCKNVEVKGDARFTSVNDVNINDINTKLVRHKVEDDMSSRPISGHKAFLSGFSAFVLSCPEGINGIRSSSLAQESQGKVLPPLTVKSLQVLENIQAETINGLLIEKFFQDCVYAKNVNTQRITNGLHIEGNIILQGKVTTPAINLISTKDLLYTVTGKQTVEVKGCQLFNYNLHMETNSSVATLNDRNLTFTYRDNPKTYENVTINGSLVLLSEVELDTIYSKEYWTGGRKLTALEKATNP